MPQLDHASYISQVFWLFILVTSFYFINVKYILPTTAEVIKIRQLKLRFANIEIKNTTNEEVFIIEKHDTVLKNVFAETRKVISNLLVSKKDWIKKKYILINNTSLTQSNEEYLNSMVRIGARKYLLTKLILHNN